MLMKITKKGLLDFQSRMKTQSAGDCWTGRTYRELLLEHMGQFAALLT